VDSLRELSHHRTTDLHVDVSASARTGAGCRAKAWASLDRTIAGHCGNVLGFVLDAAGLAAPGLGAVGRSVRFTETGHLELLDERVLERFGCCIGGAP